MGNNESSLGPFVWVAAIGVATTAINTAIGPLIRSGLVTGDAAASLQAARDPVLIVHAIATFLPMLGLAIAGFRASPFAAATAAGLTTFEKLIELVGQTLMTFPPEEPPAREAANAIFDQLYFALWLSNTIAAAAAGRLILYLWPGPRGRVAAGICWAAGALTLLMLLGDDYLGWPVPAVPGWLFFVVFTSFRAAIALALVQRRSL
jgi:hypothetical protein